MSKKSSPTGPTAFQTHFRLHQGDLWLFNNMRTLHGRAAYTTTGRSDRWLQGCYVEMDDFKARFLRGKDLASRE